MEKRTEAILSVDGRNYKLKIFGKKITLPIGQEVEFRNCSLFISDSKERLVSNKQPLNDFEIAFRKGETDAQIIARLALNFDEDMPILDDVRQDLTKLIQVDAKIEVSDSQSLGVLPNI